MRRGFLCAHKRWGQTSNTAVAAMNFRRFIRSSSDVEDVAARVSRLESGRTHCGHMAAGRLGGKIGGPGRCNQFPLHPDSYAPTSIPLGSEGPTGDMHPFFTIRAVSN